MTRQPIELGQAIQATLQTLSYQLDEQGIAVALTVPHKTMIFANEMALEQIFHNLIRNALHVSTDGQLISIQAEMNEKTVTVRISDEGPGMTDEMIEHAFERFYQGDASRGTSGTGLGLAIVQEMMHQLGGTVRIESQLGLGTTFILNFPQAD